MPTDVVGGAGLAVVAGDVLALRGTGLAAAETWALLCQAAQALQDLFLSNGGVVGGSRTGPVVTPHTLELTPRGRVLLQLAPPETARAYLPPEYRPGRVYSDTDSEKMWMYSLGRALLDTTPRVAALTGTVSVSPSSALQSVLAAMTEPDPRRRASLMNLLDVISEYCRTRLQSKPFTHVIMDMYREVVKSPQYAARKRAAYHRLNSLPVVQSSHHHPYQPHTDQQIEYTVGQFGVRHSEQRPPNQYVHRHHQQEEIHYVASTQHHPHHYHRPEKKEQHQEPPQQQPIYNTRHHHHGHHQKGALFKLQSRNSRSHPNLSSLCGQQSQRLQEASAKDDRPHFQSQIDVQRPNATPASSSSSSTSNHQQRRHHHARTYSQPVYTRLQHTRSTINLPTIGGEANIAGNVYSDPIYALPVKPFLSSQDVRVNGLTAKASMARRNEKVYGAPTINRHPSSGGYSQPDIATQNTEHSRESRQAIPSRTNPSLQRQHSNPQLPSKDLHQQQQEYDAAEFKRLSQPSVAIVERRSCSSTREEQMVQQQNPLSSMRVPRGMQGPPKPPRIITTLRKAALVDVENSQSEPPAKPPRNLIRNGPRARRGKAVQRAPSRLYRTVGGPMRCFNKAQCVGPEFVVRANQPPKALTIGQVKTGNSGRIVVIMLTGQRLEVTCDPHKVTAGDLFQAIVQAESIEENFTLGLAVLLAGDFAMLPPDTKLNKVAPPGWLSSGKSKGLLGLPTSFMLYLRLRFFLPSLRGIRDWISKHLLYLQIRRCILEQQLVCPYPELINLTGLALQAEFGNYNVSEHGCADYFLLEHYVPESLILSMDQNRSRTNVGVETLKVRLHQAHRDRRGLDSNKAEDMFISHAQALPDYGSHYYIATVDSKELEKVMTQQRQQQQKGQKAENIGSVVSTDENIYDSQKSEYPVYGRIEISRLDYCENIPKNPNFNEVYVSPKTPKLSRIEACNNKNSKSSKSKKTESNVWLAIHAQGLKLFERGGEPRERQELARFQWRDVQTLSYSKNCLVVYSKLNGKRCKFKLRMDHRKSYFAFKLTSLHHQFFLRLRSELTSLQGLAKDFGVPTTIASTVSPSKAKGNVGKTKIAIANTVKGQQRPNYPMQLEEYQNKENEKPQKDANVVLPKTNDQPREPAFYSSEEDALYAQVNVRLEPEGESRDTEDESERGLATPNDPIAVDTNGMKLDRDTYSRPRIEIENDVECAYSLPKILSGEVTQYSEKPNNPEELYAAINKVGLVRRNEFPVPEEVWEVADVKKSVVKMKTSSLPNYGTPRQASGFRTPSLPRRLGVKMGTRAIYSSLAQKDNVLADDTESLSLKSDTESSIQSLSVRSTESPLPEAYVLNADIRTDDETFRIPEDESMSASLVARLEELSFAEERILHTIKLERGHGGSIGLQVTEGNDGGVYVQAVSVGGSADMAGNVNKGDRIVAINGQNLLNLRYEDALKMLQSSSETVELVLSQPTSNPDSRQIHNKSAVDNNYLQDIRFDVSSEAETSSMTNKWLIQKTMDVASVQNTSSAYSSAASSAMGNHNANSLYLTDLVDNNGLKSASMLLSIEDFDVSRTNQVPTAPPVPPRRRKRKNQSAPSAEARGQLPVISKVIRPEHKRLPPPPPPPQVSRRSKSCANRKSHQRIMSADSQSLDESTDLLVANVELSGRTEASAEKFERPSNTKDNKNIANAGGNTWGEERAGVSERLIAGSRTLDDVRTEFVFAERTKSERNEVPRKQQFETSPRLGSFNKYPPLFFTLNDFENVISSIASFPAEEPRKSTVTIEEIPAEESELFKVFGRSDADRPIGEVEGSREKSFMDESLEEEGEFHFRVTTTDLPFERCHERWDNRSFGDAFLEGINDRNQYIFDDYMDRSSKVNIARSTRTMWYDIGDNSSDCKPRVNTKVRFVIESPSSSTPEGDFTPDTDFPMQSDSLQNIDSLLADEDEKTGQGGNSGAESALPDKFCDQTESRIVSGVSDEFGEIPFSSWLEAGNNKNCMVDSIVDDSTSSPMSVEIKQEAAYGQEQQCDSISAREGFQLDSKQSSDNNTVTRTESKNYFSSDINCPSDFTCIEKLIDSSKGKENSRISSATERHNTKSNTQQNTEQPVTNKYFTDLTNFWNTSVSCDEEFGPTVKTSSVNIQNGATSLEAPDVATENDVTLIHPIDDPRMNRNESTDLEPNACKLFANLRSSLDLSPANESDLNSSPWARDSADFEPERSWESSLSNSSVTNERKLVELAGKPESVRSLNIAEGEHCSSGSYSPAASEKRRIFVDGSQGNVVSNDRGDVDWKSPPSQRKKEPAVELRSEISTGKASDIGSGGARANNSTSKLSVGRINSEREESFDAEERVEPRNDPGKKPVNSSVPVDVRRNSFLETMLSDDVQGGSTLLPAHCKVIATHPKIGNGQDPLTEDKAGRKCRPVVPRKPVQPEINRSIGQAGKKSAGETKNEVLNELLTNFGSIILKSVGGVENDDDREISAHSRTGDNVVSEAYRSIGQSTLPKSESIYTEVTNERRSLESCDSLVCEKNDIAKEDKIEPKKDKIVSHRTDIVEDKRATVAVDAYVSQNEIYVSRIMQEIEDNVRLEVETSQQKVKVDQRSRGVRARPDNNKKTEEAERRVADDDDNDHANDDSEGRGRRLELETTSDSSSGYKCAIARETPHAQCNNNDNNRAVTTPVDLSNDQYRNETVRIVPGSVRNIVKYYEICGETTQASEHSKVRHNKPIDRPRTNARGPSSNQAGTKCQNCSSDPSSRLSVETIRPPRVQDVSPGGNDIEYTVIARNLKNERECPDTEGGFTSHKEFGGKRFVQFGNEARADPGSGRTSGKFVSVETSVEARGNSTVDGSEVGEEQTIRITEDGQKTDLPLNSPQGSGSGQQNHTVAERAEQSGISRFVPKPETPRLVFYYAL